MTVTAPAKGGGVVAYEGVVDDPDGGTVFRP